jgi:hypothetical protein
VTPKRWQRIQEIFAEALQRDPSERVGYLDGVGADASLRQDVEFMIATHEQGDSGFLERPASGSKEMLEQGFKIGQYEVLAAIGAVGMGEVYDCPTPK